MSRIFAAATLTLALLASGPAAAQSFLNFESGHVRPLALSPDGSLLFAVNTPDNRLAIFDVSSGDPQLVTEVAVGLEPIAVASRIGIGGLIEAWVVNHLSDSVSLVIVDPTIGLSRVVGTINVGDEPRDIVFAGPGSNHAYITTARRGQNVPASIQPELSTEGVPRALVWVFDATDPWGDTAFDADSNDSPLGGEPVTILELFGSQPRGLAVSPDGATVYAGIFQSGNQTTILPEAAVTNDPMALPPPPAGSPHSGPCDPGIVGQIDPFKFPCQGLIVRFDPGSGEWHDELDRDWGHIVNLSLPDFDVHPINATLDPPQLLPPVASVGTTLFNLAVHPTNGKVYVTNTESRNEVRFEALIDLDHGVQGNIIRNRITVIDGPSASPVHLNPHIDYSVTPGPAHEIAESIAFPQELVFSADGTKVYVAGMGSGVVAEIDTASLEQGVVNRLLIPVGGGPTGLVLDEANDRMFVMNRFEQRVATVSPLSNPVLRTVSHSASLRHDPSPQEIKEGRFHLYNAKESGHGDASCNACHTNADLDRLAWDLGDPFGEFKPNLNPFRPLATEARGFHPMKGPMTTQSLRGLADHGPMHWRGDRTGADIGGDPLDEDLAFKEFRVAFPGLLGTAEEPPEENMQEFTDFILTVRYPPNPIKPLDDVGTVEQEAGEDFFVDIPVDGGATCEGCHILDEAAGFFGTDGLSFREPEPQDFKIPHMRNMYAKAGMFGVPNGIGFAIPPTGHLGDQVDGFGFAHDGSIPSMFDFNSANAFNFPDPQDLLNVVAFSFAFPTGLAPAVGQQVTANALTVPDAASIARRDLLVAQALAGNCDLIMKGAAAGEYRGGVMLPSGLVRSDRSSEPLFVLEDVWNIGSIVGNEAVWTCVPPGSGQRMGIDRDEDGVFDRDELDAGSNPTDPLSVRGGTQVVTIATRSMLLKDGQVSGNPNKRKFKFKAATSKDPAANRVVPPTSGGAGDPTLGGGTLRVFNGAGGGEQVTIDLPAAKWSEPTPGVYKFKDTDAGAPIQTITVKADRIAISGKKAGWPYTLNEPSQGRMTMRLALGTAIEWCAEAPAKTTGKPPTTAANDKVDRFKAVTKFPAPPNCPAPPAG